MSDYSYDDAVDDALDEMFEEETFVGDEDEYARDAVGEALSASDYVLSALVPGYFIYGITKADKAPPPPSSMSQSGTVTTSKTQDLALVAAKAKLAALKGRQSLITPAAKLSPITPSATPSFNVAPLPESSFATSAPLPYADTSVADSTSVSDVLGDDAQDAQNAGFSTTDWVLSFIVPTYSAMRGRQLEALKHVTMSTPDKISTSSTEQAQIDSSRSQLATAQAQLAQARSVVPTHFSATRTGMVTQLTVPSFVAGDTRTNRSAPMATNDTVLGHFGIGCDLMHAKPGIVLGSGDVVGAVTTRNGPVFAKVKRAIPAGATKAKSKYVRQGAVAAKTGVKTLTSIKNAQAALKRYGTAKHKTLVTGALFDEILGAVTAKKPLTAAQTAAVNRHVAAIKKNAQSAAKTAAAAKKAQGSLATLVKAVRVHKAASDKLKAPSQRTVMHGFGADVLGAATAPAATKEALKTRPLHAHCEELEDVNKAPSDTEETYDDLFEGGSDEVLGAFGEILGITPEEQALIDATSGVSPGTTYTTDTPISSTDLSWLNTTATATDVPPTPPQPVGTVPWKTVPGDGVKYNGEKGWPRDGFGSYNVFYGPAVAHGMANGYLWGYDPAKWFRKDGTSDYDCTGGDAWPATGTASMSGGFGPLVGNPGNGDFKNLEFASDDKQWFWQAGNAPTWATAEADATAALVAQQAAKATADAQAADQAVADQNRAAEAEAQAQQDAANALAQSAADTQANIAQQASDAQQTQVETQMASQQLQFDAQQAALDQQANQMQLDYLKSNPQAMAQLMDPYGAPAGYAPAGYAPAAEQGYGAPAGYGSDDAMAEEQLAQAADAEPSDEAVYDQESEDTGEV